VDLRLHPLDAPLADLTSGEIDLRFQHTANDSLLYLSQPGLDFGAAVYFYDGASVMIRAGSGMSSWEGLENETVCAITDAPSTLEFQAEMEGRNLEFELLENETIAEMRESFLSGRCLAQLLDRSLLEIIRNSQSIPEDYEVWPTPFTLRPLTAIYRHNDEGWGEIVDAVIWGLIYAEEIGVTSENVDDLLRSSEQETDEAYLERVGPAALLLDPNLGLGADLGLPNGFMAAVIRQVGNYAEIYARHLGPDTSVHIERGLNDLWSRGGLLNAPGWR
jgi:general L-amino acid transport system substrate-binding protein